MKFIICIALGLLYLLPPEALAEEASSLARAAKNPLSDVVNLQILYDANLNTGPNRQAQHVLTLQPVIPFSINSQWSLFPK